MAQQQVNSQQPSLTGQEDEKQRRQLRICFFILLSIWTLIAIAAPLVVFCLTKQPLSFSLFSTLAPPVYLWHKFTKYLFPMDEKTFELEKIRIQAKAQNQDNPGANTKFFHETLMKGVHHPG